MAFIFYYILDLVTADTEVYNAELPQHTQRCTMENMFL